MESTALQALTKDWKEPELASVLLKMDPAKVASCSRRWTPNAPPISAEKCRSRRPWCLARRASSPESPFSTN